MHNRLHNHGFSTGKMYADVIYRASGVVRLFAEGTVAALCSAPRTASPKAVEILISLVNVCLHEANWLKVHVL